MEERFIITKQHRYKWVTGFIYEEGQEKISENRKTKRLFTSTLDARIYLKKHCEGDLDFMYTIQQVFCVV